MSAPTTAAAAAAAKPTPSLQSSCKRCNRRLDTVDPSWTEQNTLPAALADDALAHTLPAERARELRAAMDALSLHQQQQRHGRRKKTGAGGSIADEAGSSAGGGDLGDVSRFLSHSFRTDRIDRIPTTAGGGGMRGSMALVLDQTVPPSRVDGGDDATATTTTKRGADAGGSQTSFQSESFILLSSSQIHPYMFPADADDGDDGAVLGDRQLRRQQSTIRELEDISMSVYRDGHSGSAGGGDATGGGALAAEGEAAPDTTRQDDVAEKFGIIGRVMDMLDGRSTLHHPMCEDCAETMLRLMDRNLADCVRERQIVEGIGQAAEAAAAAAGTAGGGDPVPDDIAALERELATQAEEERMLEETLGTLDAQVDAMCAQIAQLQAESRSLEAEEDGQTQRRNELEAALDGFEAEQWALDDRYARLAAQLTQLQRTNVYNDVFNIAVAGDAGVASINGFRLGGRSAPHSVEWAEINAAWGQALLLLQTVARRLSHDFVGYRLIPMGAFSRIERLGDDGAGGVLELFGSGDMYLGRLFQTRRFDAAMAAFLACLDQIVHKIVGLNPQLRPPYRIDHDRIGGVSIRPQFGQDDAWTKACKNTLLVARWALAFASSHGGR
ncbi:autophagy protein [Coemansia sp. BCRC 34490]|nr:autophagy protein [Coemansia sp. BCRC 34490]